MNNPNNLPFPIGAYHRSDKWQYAGWIPNSPDSSTSKTFDELIEDAKKSDHGEIREVDIYDWGAVCWVKGMTNDQRLAKLYGVKGLPLPLPHDEDIYWMNILVKCGIIMSIGNYFEWFERLQLKREMNEHEFGSQVQ